MTNILSEWLAHWLLDRSIQLTDWLIDYDWLIVLLAGLLPDWLICWFTSSLPGWLAVSMAVCILCISTDTKFSIIHMLILSTTELLGSLKDPFARGFWVTIPYGYFYYLLIHLRTIYQLNRLHSVTMQDYCELCFGNEFQGIYVLFQSTSPVFSCRNWGKARNPQSV
jgi:hypothetical protein